MGDGHVRKVYIATWGDFHRWDKVIYEYNNRKKEAKDSLAIVAEVEKAGKGKNINDNKFSILIFLPESLVATIRKPPREPEDVSYAIESLKSECRYFIYHELGVTSDDDLAIRVIPSKGLFIANSSPCSSKIWFDTHMADAKHIMYKHLMDHIIREIRLLREEADNGGKRGGSKPRLEVILDLTHSINYFSALAHENVMKLMGLLEIVKNLLGIDTVLKVINADPYIPGMKKQNLTVNPLYTVDKAGGGRKSYIINPYLPFIHSTKGDRLNDKRPYSFKGGSDLARKLSPYLKKYVEERVEYVEFLSKAYYLNAPLALMATPLDIMERGIGEIIDIVLDTYYNKATEACKGGDTEDDREGRRCKERAPEAYRDGDILVIKRHLILTDSFHDIVSIYGFARLLNMSGRVNKCRPTMSELANFSNALYHNNVQSRMIVDNEIGSIANNICRYVIRRVKSGEGPRRIKKGLVDVFGETMGIQYAMSDKKKSTRNFVAHAGLAKEVVCIDLEVGNRLVSMINKNLEDGSEECRGIQEIIGRTRLWYNKDWRSLLRSHMAVV